MWPATTESEVCAASWPPESCRSYDDRKLSTPFFTAEKTVGAQRRRRRVERFVELPTDRYAVVSDSLTEGIHQPSGSLSRRNTAVDRRFRALWQGTRTMSCLQHCGHAGRAQQRVIERILRKSIDYGRIRAIPSDGLHVGGHLVQLKLAHSIELGAGDFVKDDRELQFGDTIDRRIKLINCIVLARPRAVATTIAGDELQYDFLLLTRRQGDRIRFAIASQKVTGIGVQRIDDYEGLSTSFADKARGAGSAHIQTEALLASFQDRLLSCSILAIPEFVLSKWKEVPGSLTGSSSERRPALPIDGYPSRRLCALLKSFPSRYPHPPHGGSMLRSYARTVVLSGIFLLLPLFVQAQAFSVGTATAEPGQKSTGYLEVPAGADAATNIPVVVINGEKHGPVLALVSGAHGTEYTSIIALEKLINLLDPTQITGTVILIPLVNVQSFEQKVPHVNPIDNKSMNRFYPGKADGTQTERASFVITKQVVDRCDYLIDYHGGDLDESLRPYAYWAPTGKHAQDQISKEMALAFGLDHIIIWRDRPTDLSATRYLDNTSTARGKPSIVVEAGYAGTVEADDLALLVDGTLSTMRALKMLTGNPRPIENPVWLDRVVDVLSDGPGIWYPVVKRGTYVQEGMKIGFVTDYFDKVILEARAPVSGVILHINAVPSLKKGDNIADIGAIASNVP
jgi:predicted deacylase